MGSRFLKLDEGYVVLGCASKYSQWVGLNFQTPCYSSIDTFLYY